MLPLQQVLAAHRNLQVPRRAPTQPHIHGGVASDMDGREAIDIPQHDVEFQMMRQIEFGADRELVLRIPALVSNGTPVRAARILVQLHF